MHFKFNSHIYLIGSGHLDPGRFLPIYQKNQYPIIAADGGANHLFQYNIIPEAIIGDLDSLENQEHWKNKTKVIKIDEQDSTDLEKCLDRIHSPLFLAFGFWGDRFDHTLEIMHALTKYKDKNIIFFCGDDIIFRIPERWQINLPIKTRISFYPLAKTLIKKSQGLKYTLDNLEMDQGKIIGTSNVTTEEKIVIEHDGGNLAVILSSQHYHPSFLNP
jgi:thiamine pyrophosphokinase